MGLVISKTIHADERDQPMFSDDLKVETSLAPAQASCTLRDSVLLNLQLGIHRNWKVRIPTVRWLEVKGDEVYDVYDGTRSIWSSQSGVPLPPVEFRLLLQLLLAVRAHELAPPDVTDLMKVLCLGLAWLGLDVQPAASFYDFDVVQYVVPAARIAGELVSHNPKAWF